MHATWDNEEAKQTSMSDDQNARARLIILAGTIATGISAGAPAAQSSTLPLDEMSCQPRRSPIGLQVNPQCVTSSSSPLLDIQPVKHWVAHDTTPEEALQKLKFAVEANVGTGKYAVESVTNLNGGEKQDVRFRAAAAYKLNPMLVSHCVDLYDFKLQQDGGHTNIFVRSTSEAVEDSQAARLQRLKTIPGVPRSNFCSPWMNDDEGRRGRLESLRASANFGLV